jgi:hypothetical protein
LYVRRWSATKKIGEIYFLCRCGDEIDKQKYCQVRYGTYRVPGKSLILNFLIFFYIFSIKKWI